MQVEVKTVALIWNCTGLEDAG